MIVELDGVTVGYGTLPVLDDLTFRCGPGELVGIVGPSGAGKTTMLRTLTGFADVFAGRVRVLGQQPSSRRPPDGVGYVPQIGTVDWDFPLTVEQVVLLSGGSEGARWPWFSRTERRSARTMLERLGIDDVAGRSIHELSGGQRQRMFVARALLHGARLLLLDEPTSGVDVATRRDVLAVLDELRLAGITVVLTTHDLNHVAAHLPRIVCLNGAITADGPPSRVLSPDVLEATYGAPMRVVYDRGRAIVVDDGALTASPQLVWDGLLPDESRKLRSALR